jgi:hypothetical protein
MDYETLALESLGKKDDEPSPKVGDDLPTKTIFDGPFQKVRLQEPERLKRLPLSFSVWNKASMGKW